MTTNYDKVYLGDGAYAQFDGYGVSVTAENGIEATDTVYLEPEVYDALVKYWNDVHGMIKP